MSNQASKERLGPLSDVEQALLYEFCWSNPVAYSLVRRLCAHGLAPVAPLPEEFTCRDSAMTSNQVMIDLREAIAECAKADCHGWRNTMEAAADEIERLTAALAACQTYDYRQIIEESDRLRAALELIANPDGRFEGEGECAAIARKCLSGETAP